MDRGGLLNMALATKEERKATQKRIREWRNQLFPELAKKLGKSKSW
jgi:hypothetical protein